MSFVGIHLSSQTLELIGIWRITKEPACILGTDPMLFCPERYSITPDLGERLGESECLGWWAGSVPIIVGKQACQLLLP